jgi:hypothetical protein
VSTAVLESINTTAVFELVRYVDGMAVPYVPYRSDCAGCCANAAAPAAPARSCCGH